MIDTHTHLDAQEFCDDLPEVIQRAKDAGIEKIFLPAIDINTCNSVIKLSNDYFGYAYPMLGLHPEEVKENWKEQLTSIKGILDKCMKERNNSSSATPVIAIGEVGLDFYWSREFEKEQLEAFEQQVLWSIETRLPLMIHCRKAQNEMVRLLNKYKHDLPGGVFHCFTGNTHEAEELLAFENFVLGIGGVLTFKKSNLPDTLKEVVPLERIVLETDSPYMAPVPYRGKRNESAFVRNVCEKLADVYNVSVSDVDRITTDTANHMFLARYL